jgi:serine/threonine protein kinase
MGKELMSEKDLEDFQAEAALMKEMPPHPNIVLFRGICLDPLCIITDYCDGGSLLKKLQTTSEDISDDQKLQWVTDIVKGMIHLHKGMTQEVIHRDLAARNILVRDSRWNTNYFSCIEDMP